MEKRRESGKRKETRRRELKGEETQRHGETVSQRPRNNGEIWEVASSSMSGTQIFKAARVREEKLSSTATG